MTFLGWLSDPFKGLSDLQLGDEKGTLNHLVDFFCADFARCLLRLIRSPPSRAKGAWSGKYGRIGGGDDGSCGRNKKPRRKLKTTLGCLKTEHNARKTQIILGMRIRKR